MPGSAQVTTEPTEKKCDSTAAPSSPVSGSRATSEYVMCRTLLRRRHRDDAAASPGLELDRARALGVDRVVPADAGAVARLELGAALANDDLAARDGLAGEHLHAEPLGVRVAPVATRPETLLMSHPRPPSSSCAASRTSAWPAPSWSSPPSAASRPVWRPPSVPRPPPCPALRRWGAAGAGWWPSSPARAAPRA